MSDQLLPIPDLPAGLREAAQLGTLIPFIGAGVSRLAGRPGWAEFADSARQSLVDQGKLSYSQLDQIRNLSPRVKLSLARSLEAEHGITIDYRRILRRRELREDKQGCRLYNSLFRLGKIFVTTNYDLWLDEYIPQPTPSVAPAVAPPNTAPIAPMRVLCRVEDFLPRDFMPLASRNTSAGRPVVLDTALLPRPFLPPSAKETRSDCLCPDGSSLHGNAANIAARLAAAKPLPIG